MSLGGGQTYLIPEEAHAPPAQAQQHYLPKRLRSAAQLPFKEQVLKWAEDIYKQAKLPEMMRAQTSVTLEKRFRGVTLDDRLGTFSLIPGNNDWTPINTACLHAVNIVKPLVRTNAAAMATANVIVKVDATDSKQARMKGAAAVAKGVGEWVDLEQWTPILKGRINALSQLGYGYGVMVAECDGEEDEDRAEWNDEEIGSDGEYQCACGSRGTFKGEAQDDPEGSGLKLAKCPDCGDDAVVTKEPSSESFAVPSFYKEKSRSTEAIVATSFELRIDESRSQGGNLDGARWFEYHHLQSRLELEQENPDIDYGVPEEWSYPLRWQYSLETGTEYSKWSAREQREVELFEAREIYLRPEWYRFYVAPQDYQLTIRGEVVFQLEAGQRLIEVAPNGIRLKVTGKEIVHIKVVDFRKRWSYGGFVPDPLSFWMQPLTELLIISDEFNEMWTITIQAASRNSVINIVYDVEQFDGSSFENDLTPTRPGLDRDRPLDDYYGVLAPPALTQPMAHMEFMRQLLPDISLVQPALQGAQPKAGDPYAAQLLQKQSSLGVLSPALISEAQAKVRHVKNTLRMLQEFKSPEWFMSIGTRFGEEWKEEDIEAFMECDIDRDLEFSFIEGTEIPTSLIERKIEFSNLIDKLLAIAQATQNPSLIPDEFVSKLIELGGGEIDLGNVESNERLAQSRFETLKEIAKQGGEKPEPLILEMLMRQHHNLIVLPEENHKVGVEFYSDQQVALMSRERVDMTLVALCQRMIALHRAGGVTYQQDQAQDMIAGKQPLVDAQAEIAAQGQEQEQGANQAQSGAEDAKAQAEREMQSQESEAGRQHELTKLNMAHSHEAGKQAAEHAHQVGVKAMELQAQAEVAKQSAQRTQQT